MKRPRTAAGFTIVELAAATAVASIALAATAAAVTSGARLARTTVETRAAARAAATVMERVRATPFSQIQANFTGSTLVLSTLAGAESTGTAQVGVTELSTGSTRWRVLRVSVTTRWRGVNGDTSKTFVIDVSDRNSGSSLAGVPTLPAN